MVTHREASQQRRRNAHAARRGTHRAAFIGAGGRCLAAVLLVASLALAGCDFLDSNRPEEVAHNAKFVPDLEKPEFLGPPVIDVPWLSLVASWRLDPTGALYNPMVTFWVDQKVAVETACYDYRGTFKATGDGQLAILKLVPDLEGKRCEALVEDPLIAALEAATHYKVAETVLLIYSESQDDPLAFELEVNDLGDDDGSDDDEPKEDDSGDDGSGDDGSDDDEPKEDDGSGDDGSDDDEPKEDDSDDDGGSGDESEDKEDDGGDSPCNSLTCTGNGGGDDGGSGDDEPKEDDGSGDDGSGDDEPKEDDGGSFVGSDRPGGDGGALTDNDDGKEEKEKKGDGG